MNDYRKLLLDMQKIRFDLGLDEYKRAFPSGVTAGPSVTAPDRATTEQQVREAVASLEEILATRVFPG